MAVKTRQSRPPLAALVLLTGIGPLAVDSYLAGLPALQHSLHTSAALSQLTITAFIVGMALGQLGIGPDQRRQRTPARARRRARRPSSSSPRCAPSCRTRRCSCCSAAAGLRRGRRDRGRARDGQRHQRGRRGRPPLRHAGLDHAARPGGRAADRQRHPRARLLAHGLRRAGGDRRRHGRGRAAAAGNPPAGTAAGQPPRGHAHRMADLGTDWSYMRHVAIQCLATMGFFVYIGGSSFALETIYGISQPEYAPSSPSTRSRWSSRA